MYSYPILTKIFEEFLKEKEENLSNTFIIACQHILEPQQKMFRMLADFGVSKKNIFILGKSYSTNIEVLEELIADDFHIVQHQYNPAESFDETHQKNCRELVDRVLEYIRPDSRIIVLDDGGSLISECNNRFDHLSKDAQLFGVEQTSSGFRKLESRSLKFPVMNVARSAWKLEKEPAFIAQDCIEKIDRFTAKLPYRKAFVVGLGPIGGAIEKHLKNEGLDVYGFDVLLGHTDLVSKILEIKPSLIIGATGSQILTEHELEMMTTFNQNVYLVSVSSSDREFPVVGHRNGQNADDVHVSTTYKNITFVNNGFPVNFQGNRYEGEIEGIEPTIGQLLGSVLYCLTHEQALEGKIGFIELPLQLSI